MTSLFALALTGTPPVTLTTANSNFTSVSGSTSNTIDTVGGKVCYRCNPPSAAAYGQKAFASAVTEVYFSVDVYYPAASTAGAKRFLQFNDSSNAQACAIAFSSNPSGTPARPIIRNNANTATTLGAQASAYYPTGQWCRVEGHVVCNGSAGTIQIRIYTNDTDSTVFYDSGVVSNFNAGTNILRVSLGMTDTSGIDTSFRNFRVGDAADGWYGPAPVATAPATAQGSISLTGSAAIIGPAVASGTGVISLNGSANVPNQATDWLNRHTQGDQNVMHRDGSSRVYGEETRAGYNYTAATYPDTALEVSFYACSTGELVASHDQSTLRVFGVNYDIPTTPWSTLQSLTTLIGGYPIATVDQILADHPNSIFVLENKNGANNAARAAYVDNLCHGRWISKTSGGNVDWNNKSAVYGAPAMLYLFPQDIDVISNLYNQWTGTTKLIYEIADFSVNVGNANYPDAAHCATFFNFCIANNIPTWASIISTKAQKATADAAAATSGTSYAGYMISNADALLSSPGTGVIQLNGTGAASSAPTGASGTGAITLTGSGSSSGQPVGAAGNGSIFLTGIGSSSPAPGSASGSGSISLTGVGSALSGPAPASANGVIALYGSGSAAGQSVPASAVGSIQVFGVGLASARVPSATGQISVAGTGSIGVFSGILRLVNGEWITQKVYRRISGVWVEQSVTKL